VGHVTRSDESRDDGLVARNFGIHGVGEKDAVMVMITRAGVLPTYTCCRVAAETYSIGEKPTPSIENGPKNANPIW
jgi:hypothetical protein